MGGSLGTPDYRNGVNGISGDGSGVGGKLFGGYQLTPHLAFEGGLFDLGHIDDSTGKVKLRGGYVDAVGSYEFAPHWSLLGRAGLAQGRFSTNNGADSSPALKVGAGLQYDLSKTTAVRAEYEHYHFNDAFGGEPNVGAVSVGLKFAF